MKFSILVAEIRYKRSFLSWSAKKKGYKEIFYLGRPIKEVFYLGQPMVPDTSILADFEYNLLFFNL